MNFKTMLLIPLQLRVVYSRGTRAFDSQHGGHEFQSRSLALEAGDQTLVRRGGFLIVERVLRPYHWPRHC